MSLGECFNIIERETPALHSVYSTTSYIHGHWVFAAGMYTFKGSLISPLALKCLNTSSPSSKRKYLFSTPPRHVRATEACTKFNLPYIEKELLTVEVLLTNQSEANCSNEFQSAVTNCMENSIGLILHVWAWSC